jgi:hypothetical protein
MNPTLGVLISVGGSVIVAVVAFITTWAVTGRTINADRDRRLWDKESAAYELALSELTRMQVVRMQGQAGNRLDLMAEYLAQRKSPSWIQAQGMLLAYAPQEVHDALDRSAQCYVQAAGYLNQIEALRDRHQNEGPDGKERRLDQVLEVADKLNSVVVDADKEDQALANTIRAQLGKEPVALALPTRPKLTD